MNSSLSVTVNLHHADPADPPTIVLINANQHGQLPAVLVDPVDHNGRVAPGMWLGDDLGDRADGNSYVRLKR